MQRRADVYLREQIVIEIQCSPITDEEYSTRNIDYKKQEIYPVWVFGGEYYNRARKHERYGKRILSVEETELRIYGSIFYHNKYKIFVGDFKKKLAKGYYNKKCDLTGWYKLYPVSYECFLKMVECRMKKDGFINWKM